MRPALFLIFAATGFSALTLQVVWHDEHFNHDLHPRDEYFLNDNAPEE